ncbi:MAG: 3-hydroxyacyl-CoA dehydrogenase / enoyl-CoA hydratase / 3-hydroxybutyryl-CoA epimerase [Rhodocyclaceae bacterium]|nr:MAG: 3-hydroxyacyl-CoA dehydrogenase / enoyl-CoA hydratase / 3-hydroxybutyryl-CoA epimerase [Rhodocyclaceae bacterium]TND04127.1 MAG: 3-hydroxyacyl-CoA dehydrogenase / enoyl-CoA hydratase / 3-hydroxybutyryl-CoA epimerase [Rhodocyclaceae bacterium]
MLNYSVDAEGIATVEFDYPDKSQNILNAKSMGAYAETMQKALADPAVKGIVVASAKKDFIAGGDLAELGAAIDAAAFHASISDWHKLMRAIELGGKPVAAALNGTTLGGGLEIALGCHYRVAADNPKARFGFPEVTLGLLPGAGGTQRVPRLVGMMAAAPLLMEGKRIKAAEAQKIGMIHAVVKVGDERTAARQWVADTLAAGTKPLQPWDAKGFKIPGGGPNTPNGMQMLMAANAMLREKTYDNYPAPRHILSCVYEGLSTNIDTGLAIEARYFTNLVMSPVSKNMIRSLFFGMNEANKLASRPAGVPPQKYTKIGMLGAGMMGAGIAMSTATAGIDIVLLDTTQEAADKGKDYARKQWNKQAQRGRMTPEAMEALLARIHPTASYADLAGCELVIEAVFEKREIKADVTRKTEAVIAPDAIFASNTSTLPITGLAEASVRPANFIGLHFFSPAEKMPLVEIIVGKATSDATLARSMDYVRAIGKTPIVVNDSRGFYTSRVFGTYVSEGMALLEEGVPPALIDKAGLIAGMPVGPLALADEVSIELVHKIAQQTRADLGKACVERAADRVAAKMVADLGRLGRKSGAGFYDYPADGPKHLWPGLAEQFPLRVGADGTAMLSLDEIVERLILVQSVETVRCLEEKVLRAPIDADVGAILGWGYPPFRGGPIGWLHTLGLTQAVATLDRLAERHGARFAPPKILRDMAARGERFYPA